MIAGLALFLQPYRLQRYLEAALGEANVVGTPALPAHAMALADCYFDRFEATHRVQVRVWERVSERQTDRLVWRHSLTALSNGAAAAEVDGVHLLQRLHLHAGGWVGWRAGRCVGGWAGGWVDG